MARVCMIAYSEYVSDARIRREAESLAQRGDHVDLVCLPHEHGIAATTLSCVHLYPVAVRRYRGSSNLRYVWSYVAFFWRAFFCVSLRHLRLRYDLVQVHTMPDFMVFAALVPRLSGAAVLLDVHDLMPELYMSKFNLSRGHILIRALVLMERASVAFAHRAIAVHQTHLQALTSHGSAQERFEVLLNTPDPAVFAASESRRVPRGSGGFRLVYHGTISKRHGLDLALRAAAVAREAIPGLSLSIIGDGDDLGRLTHLTEELGLDGTVEFTRASVPVNELPSLLAGADLGVVPLKRDCFTEYMLPVKLMEYVALGIPVVVTRTRTIEQYFDDSMVEYITGDCVEELAGTMVRLYVNPNRRMEMAYRAGEFTKRYNWPKQKLVYYRLVDSLVRRKVRPGRRGRLGRSQKLRNTDAGVASLTQRSSAAGGR